MRELQFWFVPQVHSATTVALGFKGFTQKYTIYENFRMKIKLKLLYKSNKSNQVVISCYLKGQCSTGIWLAKPFKII